MHNIFESLFSDLSKSPDPGFGMISAYLQAGAGLFDREAFLSFRNKSSKNSGLVENLPAIPRPENILPIEFFKDQSLLQRFQNSKVTLVKTFLSSGTTGQDQSRSPFSETGLENYRIESILGFMAALQTKFKDTKPEDLLKIQGISLIPSSVTWPNSSLAQMMSWISDHFGLTFVGEGPGALQGIDFSRPVWIFGTAFHFVNLIDDGCKQKLTENSLIIETGGTKGRSRSVTRSELFDLISDAFGIPQTRIISEYGMSELATQAYDLETSSLSERWYSFPAWIDAHVLVEDGSIKKEGVGAIIISDPFRTDFTFSIRTEDIVLLQNNRFQILRRSRSAPLKGCSLLAEQIPLKTSQEYSLPKTSLKSQQEKNDPIRWANESLELCSSLLAKRDIYESFVKEFGHKDLAAFAVEDLTHSLSLSADEFALSAKRSRSEDQKAAWTIIAPNSHSLAVVHPLLIGFVAGLDIAVRVPKKFSGKKHFLMQLIDGLNKLRQDSILLLPHDFHIKTENDIYKQGNILVFGTNATLKQLQSIAPRRISGFGETLAVGCGDLEDVKVNAKEIVRDFFSLRQTGCMSARAFILQEKSGHDLEHATNALIDATDSYRSHLTVDDATALHGEAVRLKLLGFDVSTINGSFHMPVVARLRVNGPRTNGLPIAQKSYVIPVISIKSTNWDDFIKSLKTEFFPELPVSLVLLSGTKKNQENLKVSPENPMSPLSFRIFGQSQSPTFTGMHEGRPLFSTNH